MKTETPLFAVHYCESVLGELNTSWAVRESWSIYLIRDSELVRVFVTGEMARFVFAKSLLDRDGIEYLTKNETVKSVLGWNPTGGFDLIPAELWVRLEDKKRALLLLRELAKPQGGTAI